MTPPAYSQTLILEQSCDYQLQGNYTEILHPNLSCFNSTVPWKLWLHSLEYARGENVYK